MLAYRRRMGTGKFGVNKMMGVRSLLELFCSTSPIDHTFSYMHYHKIGYTEFYQTDETFHINSVCNSEMSKKKFAVLFQALFFRSHEKVSSFFQKTNI